MGGWFLIEIILNFFFLIFQNFTHIYFASFLKFSNLKQKHIEESSIHLNLVNKISVRELSFNIPQNMSRYSVLSKILFKMFANSMRLKVLEAFEFFSNACKFYLEFSENFVVSYFPKFYLGISNLFKILSDIMQNFTRLYCFININKKHGSEKMDMSG